MYVCLALHLHVYLLFHSQMILDGYFLHQRIHCELQFHFSVCSKSTYKLGCVQEGDLIK